METYQTLGPQSPQYAQMLTYYNARCLSGSSSQPGWEGDNHHRYDHDRRGYDDRWRRGW